MFFVSSKKFVPRKNEAQVSKLPLTHSFGGALRMFSSTRLLYQSVGVDVPTPIRGGWVPKGNSSFSQKLSYKLSQTLRHWIVQRLTAICLIFALPLLAFLFSSSLSILDISVYNCTSFIIMLTTLWVGQSVWVKSFVLFLSLVILLHIKEGIENVIQDYVHNEKTKMVSFYFLVCFQIFVFKQIYLWIEVLPLT